MAERDIGNLRTRLSWEDEGANRSLEGFRRDLKGLRSEMNLAKSGGKEYSNSLKGMREQSDILSRRLKTQQERVRELKRRYDESVRVKGEDAEQTKNLAAQYNNATADMNRTEQQLKNLNAEIKRQESPWTKLGEKMTNAGDKMQKFGRGMTDFGKSYSMRVTAPIVAGGVAVFKAASDYESAFAGVRKTVDATEQQFDALSTGIRAMAKEMPTSATEIAGVAEAAGQLGIKTDAILGFTRTMVDLGVATNMSSEEAATSLARLANITGMSQKDFDKLGSVVVDLGNNLATTESEIVAMGLRLAGAGKQVGLTEAQTLSFAAALSSVGIEAEAGGSAFSKVMVNMQLAAEKGGDSLNNFAKVAGMSSSDFKKAYEKDATGAISAFIKGLATAEDRGLSAIGILDEMGITEVRMRDALLRAAGASDVFSEALGIGTKAWQENTALTKEAEQRYKTTESQMKIMWNRAKDVAITLGEALVPAVIDAIDAAGPLIEKIESGAQAFADMDESQQRTILKMIAFAAAVGPASIVLGNMTTAIGGVMKVGGGLAKTLGKSGGTGLLGRIGMLGTSAGPVGLAIAGVGALGYGIYALSKDNEKLEKVSFKTADALNAQYQETDKMIGEYDKLRTKSQLTSDEFARYVDLQAELSRTSDPKAIESIKDEMAKLQKHSGLSADEFDRMVGLNGDLTEAMPNATNKVSDQGEAIAGTTEEMKKYNEETLKMATRETEEQFYKALGNQAKLIEKMKDDQKELNRSLDLESQIQELLYGYSEKTAKKKMEQFETEIESLNTKIHSGTLQEDELANAIIEKENKEVLLNLLKGGRDTLYEQLGIYKEKNTERQKELEKTKTQLGQLDEAALKLQKQYLLAAGISDEKAEQVIKEGTSIELLDKQIGKLQKQKEKLREQTPAAQRNTQEYKDAVGEIDNQIGKMKTAKDNIRNLEKAAGEYTDELGKDVSKNVNVKTNPAIWKIDNDLSKPVRKTLNIATAVARGTTGMWWLPSYASNADGTDYFNHPSGKSWLGEEGAELVRHGNRWALADFGLYDVPRGSQIFTHDESKKIIRALNNMPGYASGISPSGEADRVVNSLNNQQRVPVAGEAVIYTTVINQVDGRELSRRTYRHVTEFQERDKKARESFA